MSNKKNSYRWVVLVVACLCLFAPNYAQYQLSPLAPQLMSDLGLTTSQFSSIFSAPMIPAIFLSLVAGVLADKFGIKRVVAVGLAISSVGACLRIGAGNYGMLFVSMLMTGFGVAFLNVNGAKIFGSWFPPEQISSMMGIFLAASTASMTVGMATTAMLPGIQTAYIVAAVLIVSVSVLWVLFMKNPQTQGSEQASPALPILDCLKVVVKSRGVWITGLCLMGIMGCNVIISSFLPTALGGRGINPISAGAYGSAVTIGNLIGCMAAPAIAAKTGKNKQLIPIFALIAALGATFGWQAPSGAPLAICLCITGIAIGGMMPILMSFPIQLPEIGPIYAGTAGGFTGTLQLLGAVVIPTYIVAPLAKTNMNLFFMAGGICMALVFVFGLGLPELGKSKRD